MLYKQKKIYRTGNWVRNIVCRIIFAPGVFIMELAYACNIRIDYNNLHPGIRVVNPV